MRMRNLFLPAFLFFLWAGTAASDTQKAFYNGPTKWKPYVGCKFVQSEKGVKILSVAPDSPAGQAGMMPGDIVTRINGYHIISASQCFYLISVLKPDRATKFRIVRGGEIKHLLLAPKLKEAPKFVNANAGGKLTDLVSKNKKVDLLVVIGEAAGEKNNDWQAEMRSEARDYIEKACLDAFSDYPNFRLVDRNKTDELLKETRFFLRSRDNGFVQGRGGEDRRGELHFVRFGEEG